MRRTIVVPSMGVNSSSVLVSWVALLASQAVNFASTAARFGRQICRRLSRLRCTDEGIPMASRYFATVRRAISIPSARRRSTIVSSDKTFALSSPSISFLIRSRTASAEWLSPAPVPAIEVLKKYFSS